MAWDQNLFQTRLWQHDIFSYHAHDFFLMSETMLEILPESCLILMRFWQDAKSKWKNSGTISIQN